MAVIEEYLSGKVQKLKGVLLSSAQPIQYYIPINDQDHFLNPWIGRTITLSFGGKIHCIACNRSIKKSFQQGYCFPCAQQLARCDICMVRPEKCHFWQGTCREPVWAETHCMIPHIVYLANTSSLKVGISRETQIPTRWIDQGAIQALPLARVKNRYQAGLVETALAKNIADKTDWRKMLKNEVELLDLKAIQISLGPELKTLLQESLKKIECVIKATKETTVIHKTEVVGQPWLEENTVLELHYPVIDYPKKIVSINLEKTPTHQGTLLGIKGQYLIFDSGVINIRNIAGYHLKIQ